MAKKYHITGNGVCQKRSLDCRRIADYIATNGGEVVADPEEADVVVVATCAFIDSFVTSACDCVRRIKALGKETIVFGCLPDMAPNRYGQVHDGAHLATKNIEGIDALFPEFTIPFKDIPDAYHFWASAADGRLRECRTKTPFEITNRKKPMLRIGYGCLGACTYCVHVHSVGRLRSKPLADCLSDYARMLQDDPDVVFIHADDPGAWGMDIGSSFPELLDALLEADQGSRCKWLLLDVNPRWVIRYADDLARIVATGKVSQLGSPIQSGSDRVLKRMRRGYDTAAFTAAMGKIIAAAPDIKFNTHLIIGFPGETDEDFERSLTFFDEVKTDGILLFRYSCLNQSKSSTYKDILPDALVEARMEEAIARLKGKARILDVFNDGALSKYVNGTLQWKGD